MLTQFLAAALVAIIFYALYGFCIFCYRLFHGLKTDFGYGKKKNTTGGPGESSESAGPPTKDLQRKVSKWEENCKGFDKWEW